MLTDLRHCICFTEVITITLQEALFSAHWVGSFETQWYVMKLSQGHRACAWCMVSQVQLCFKAHDPATSPGPISGASLQQTLSDGPDGEHCTELGLLMWKGLLLCDDFIG